MSLYISFPKATKTDIIRNYLDAWDPLQMREQAGYMFYNHEANAIAQIIRKNSKSSGYPSLYMTLWKTK